ncbi:aldose epimerase family protein [Ruminiclostridium cellulolyticum]|uniref:Aldose 1-epimerase n=1 Tax=Ruminiclostridium cellulolyticum (strain ATCC 35319 / DSM 5812 / JCM 6584 / H10) TaxID=394503 RepID=B8I1I7_RUMCH|nr:aldose epimerase family protein [Ruminiclostridium cellulolyticum]ACL75785.1 Aldose 1-epimerase [Ruminiclostridium cellulolyticum H10]
MTITKRYFGTLPGGTEANIYTLKNSNNMSVDITNYGGTIVSILVPDKNGKIADIALGFDDLKKYTENDAYIGALIGRHGNRIEDAKFELNGKVYELVKNDGNNHLHGGTIGFHNVVWNADIQEEKGVQKLILTHTSPDGEENYPGNLNVKVEYSLTEDNELKIDYTAISDKDTVVNLTNHAYFNLSGHDSGDVLKHQIYINADNFTPVNDECIPTGEIREVKGTVMDFTQLRSFSEGLSSTDQQVVNGGGYDHNWALNTKGNINEVACELYDPESGRAMQVFTTKPGVQFYSGNHLSKTVQLIGKNSAVYNKRAGLCLETQYFPNAMRHKNFPSPILNANEKYHHITIYKFLNK